MDGSETNKLILEIIGRLVGHQPPRVPMAYGDSALKELLALIEYAQVAEFRFVDVAGRPSKRNLLEWLKGRRRGRRVAHEKLYGFIRFAVALSWRSNVANLIQELLDDAATVRSIHLMTFQGEEKVSHLRAVVAVNPYVANKDGQIPVNERYGVIRWQHEIAVNAEGGGSHQINAQVCNLQEEGLSLLTPPIFVDRPCDVSSLHPWTEAKNHTATARIEDWNGTSGAVFVEIDPPLGRFEPTSLSWGYETPGLFAPGEEYYRFDINNPTGHRLAVIRFNKSWKVSNVRTLDGKKSFLISENAVKWEHFFPKVGIYEVRFNLSRGDNSANAGTRI